MLKACLISVLVLVLNMTRAYADSKHLNMLVLGDSISQGTDAVGIGLFPDYNWATGTKVESHLSKLRKLGYSVDFFNASIPGAHSAMLSTELALAPTQAPDYVLLEIGANDLCATSPSDDTVGNVAGALRTLISANPDVKIVLVAIPRLSAVYESKKSSHYCRFVWSTIPLCPAFLSPYLSAAQREVNQIKVNAANQGFKELSEHFGPNVHFVEEAGEETVKAEDVSNFDCFHPSVRGQQHLSDATFKPELFP